MMCGERLTATDLKPKVHSTLKGEHDGGLEGL